MSIKKSRANESGETRAIAAKGDGGAPTPERQAKPYLSILELSQVTPWTELAIRTMMSRGILKRGVHYFDVGRRRFFKWVAVVAFIEGKSVENTDEDRIPLRSGGFLGEPEKPEA